MSWRDEYMQALRERDVESRSNYELIEAYTKLIDRTIALEAEKAASLEGTSQQAALPKEAVLQSTSTTSRNEVVPLSQLKLQSALAETIRQKGQLESRLKDAEAELLKAKLHIKNDTETIRELTSDKSTLSIRLKDKNEELRGKAKLLEDVQDEMISVTLQRNVSEQRNEKLQAENKELVDRWMARMSVEADAMNKASAFS